VPKPESPEPLEFTPQARRVPVAPPGAPQPRPPLIRMPLWAKWVTSLLVVVVLLVALVVYVSHHNTNDSNGQALTKTGLVEQNHDATVLQEQDQTPQEAKVPVGMAPLRAVAEAVHSNMAYRIQQSEAGPPLKPARCTASSTVGAKHGYSCTVLSGGLLYDFDAVIDRATRVLTLCKRDPPPAPQLNVPLDRVCYA
jgi:hypothetical protein